MTTTTSQPVTTTVPVEQVEDDDVAHVVCCEDENSALCGRDVTDEEWTSDEDVPDCEVCDRIEAALVEAAKASTSGHECIGCWRSLLD